MTYSATTSSYLQLPIIDLSAADRGPEARALLHAQLHSAAHDVGFFQLVGHGVGKEEMGRLDSAMRAFFALPEAERLALDKWWRIVEGSGLYPGRRPESYWTPRLAAVCGLRPVDIGDMNPMQLHHAWEYSHPGDDG